MKTYQTDYGIFTIFNDDYENNITLSKNRIQNQELFESVLKPYILKATILVDVGSESGIRNIFFTKINPSINMYCFEPRENYFCLLTKNITANNIENTVLMNNMLGHITGTIKAPSIERIICDHDDIIEIGNGILIGGKNDPIHFVTLDSLRLIKCDFIFIDIKGFDYLVLLGGINTIKKFKPTICFKNDIENTTNILLNIGISETIFNNSYNLLEKLDYKLINIDNDFIIAIANVM